jgi:hypothetical protein
VESIGKDFDWQERNMSSWCHRSNECCSYIPGVGVVDSRDHDIAEDKSDPRICLLDNGKAHISVNNTVSVYLDVASGLD